LQTGLLHASTGRGLGGNNYAVNLIPESPEEVVMDAIAVFSAKGGNGLRPAANGLRPAVYSFLWCFIFSIPVAASAAQTSDVPLDGGYAPGNLPISLGTAPGCPWPSAYAMNGGAYPDGLVVAGSMWCGDGTNDAPYQWHAGVWSALGMPAGASGSAFGNAMSVSDDPNGPATFTYRLFDGSDNADFYVITAGDAPVKLDVLPDSVQGNTAVLSAQGNHIVGGNSAGDWEVGFTHRAVRWSREDTGWSMPEELGPGEAVATSEDGSIVVGKSDPWAYQYYAEPWVWEAGAEGGELTLLESEATVNDISHDGSMIVGSRPEPCSNPERCDFFPVPVYWVREQGTWVMHDLEALDGVTSTANAVAIVDGSPVIVGDGYTSVGAIHRAVAWIPAADGSYGAPLRLESLGGNFNSWAGATDVNREGLVLGWSEPEPYHSPGEIVIWSLTEPLPFQINAGISDAWYNPDTDGQGFFINVWDNIQTMFVGWLTYGEGANGAGHYWMTAQGPFADNRADLEITLSEGGAFDAGQPVPSRTPDGTMTVEFSDCLHGMVTYDIPSIGRQGTVPIQRLSGSHVPNCEYQRSQSVR